MNDARHDPVSPRPRGVFLAVNASFSHAGIAAGYFKGIAESAGWDWHTEELVRGEAVQPALVRVCALRPRMLAATFYLFTRQVALSFIRRFKALQPECLVVAGGPEFLGDNRAFLEAEPAVDLAVAAAVASSLHNRPVRSDMALFGEIGLAGELRAVTQTDRRLREAAKLGFTRGLIPGSRGAAKLSVPGLTIASSRSVVEAIAMALE